MMLSSDDELCWEIRENFHVSVSAYGYVENKIGVFQNVGNWVRGVFKTPRIQKKQINPWCFSKNTTDFKKLRGVFESSVVFSKNSNNLHQLQPSKRWMKQQCRIISHLLWKTISKRHYCCFFLLLCRAEFEAIDGCNEALWMKALVTSVTRSQRGNKVPESIVCTINLRARSWSHVDDEQMRQWAGNSPGPVSGDQHFRWLSQQW